MQREAEEQQRLADEAEAERSAMEARDAARALAKAEADERAQARAQRTSQQFLDVPTPGTPPDHTSFLGSGMVKHSPGLISSPHRRVTAHRRSSSAADVSDPSLSPPRRIKHRRHRNRHRALVDIIFTRQNSLLLGFVGGMLVSMYIMNRIRAMIGFITGY